MYLPADPGVLACSGFFLSPGWMPLLLIPSQMCQLWPSHMSPQHVPWAQQAQGTWAFWQAEGDRENRQTAWQKSLMNLLKASPQQVWHYYHTWSCSHSVPCWQTPVKTPIHPKLKYFVSPSPNAAKPLWWKAPPADTLPWKRCSNELAGKTVSQKEDPWAAPFTIGHQDPTIPRPPPASTGSCAN